MLTHIVRPVIIIAAIAFPAITEARDNDHYTLSVLASPGHYMVIKSYPNGNGPVNLDDYKIMKTYGKEFCYKWVMPRNKKDEAHNADAKTSKTTVAEESQGTNLDPTSYPNDRICKGKILRRYIIRKGLLTYEVNEQLKNGGNVVVIGSDPKTTTPNVEIALTSVEKEMKICAGNEGKSTTLGKDMSECIRGIVKVEIAGLGRKIFKLLHGLSDVQEILEKELVKKQALIEGIGATADLTAKKLTIHDHGENSVNEEIEKNKRFRQFAKESINELGRKIELMSKMFYIVLVVLVVAFYIVYKRDKNRKAELENEKECRGVYETFSPLSECERTEKPVVTKPAVELRLVKGENEKQTKRTEPSHPPRAAKSNNPIKCRQLMTANR